MKYGISKDSLVDSVNTTFVPECGGLLFAADGFRRYRRDLNPFCSERLDVHSKQGIKISYVQVKSTTVTPPFAIPIAGTIGNVSRGDEFGILLQLKADTQQYTVWLPSACYTCVMDRHKRLSAFAEPCIHEWQVYPQIEFRLLAPTKTHQTVFVPYIVLEDPDGRFFREINILGTSERRLYRKSDWFFATKPADIWNYLINGTVYDPRVRRGVDKRVKCQQCAYAWWSYFGFLHRETGKQIYNTLQDEVAYSTLLDMSEQGQEGHGYWSNAIETHARFHLDGVHLLISQYEKTGIRLWLEAAEQSMTFVREHLTEKLDGDSIWFLHDTVEGSRPHHFKSTILGKSSGNSLCLNTHIQALTVLFRLPQLSSEKERYNELFERGVKGLRKVLDLTGGELIYRGLMVLLVHHREQRRRTGMGGKVMSALLQWLLPKSYWAVRRRFPRIIFPNGFIERDLSLTFFSDSYHIINLKDLLTLYRQTQYSWLRPYINNALNFVRAYTGKIGLANALARSPFYIELLDVLHLYNELVDEVPAREMSIVENTIYQQTRGYSLDYYASEFVQAQYRGTAREAVNT